MPEFKLRKLKGELFEILGLEAYLEKKISALKSRLLRTPAPSDVKPVEYRPAIPPVAAVSSKKFARTASEPAPTAKKTAPVSPKKSASKAKSSNKKAAIGTTETKLLSLINALDEHPKKDELVKAGAQKDQLLRSLIPLYLARGLDLDVSSGVISRFWQAQGISYAAPNAAKALRQHVGYSRETKTGRQVTPNGVKYVENALAKKRAA